MAANLFHRVETFFQDRAGDSGTGLAKIEPKRKPVKYSRGGTQRRRSRV